MDAQQFLAEFGYIAGAQGGVQCLREMIYNLAITGNLTRQFPEDGDAQTLLQDIEIKRQSLIQSKQFKRTAKLESEPLLIPDNITLPTSWCWTRLLDIGEISPRNEAKDDDFAAFIPMSGIPQLHNGNLEIENRTWGEIKKGFTHFANGDVVVAKITPCFENGKAAVISGLDNMQGIGAGTTELHVFRAIHPEVLSTYVYIFLRSPFFTVEGESNMTGTAGQKRLPTEYFATRAMPLPPFAEQERIVAKVNELMALCDKLEIQLQNREHLQTLARKSVVAAFERVSSPNELQNCWSRLSNEINALFGKSLDVIDLREVILELAALGILSEFSLSDTPATDLIEESVASKRKRIADGVIKIKKASATDVSEQEMPAPKHWVKVSLDDLFQFIDYRGKTPIKTNAGVVLVTAKNVRPGALVSNPVEYISEQSYKAWMTRGFPREGDLLITTEAPLGNIARINSIPNFALAQRVIDLQPFAEINTTFFMYFMMSPSFQKVLLENSTGMTAKGIKAAKLKQLMVSVPPREEQDRIVQRVEKLLEVCGTLEAQLDLAHSTASKLAKAAIATITGIRNEEEEEALKTPKTELISKLRLANSPSTKEQAPLAAILARHQSEMSAGDLWQRYGGEIDAFYAQLKQEVGKGWIAEPAIAEMRETETG